MPKGRELDYDFGSTVHDMYYPLILSVSVVIFGRQSGAMRNSVTQVQQCRALRREVDAGSCVRDDRTWHECYARRTGLPSA